MAQAQEPQAQDVRRLFLQAVLSRGMMSEKMAKNLWHACADAVQAADENLDISHPDTADAWSTFVASLNTTLNSLDFEFRMIQNQGDEQKTYVLVNAKDDEIAQIATDYSPSEIAFFKYVVEAIMLAPREAFSVSSLAALRGVSELKGKSNATMTKTQAEVVLGSFVARGWLVKSRRGRYSLSPRSISELQPYIRANFSEDIVECTICHEMITYGIGCSRANCQTRMHQHCFTVYSKPAKKDVKVNCPACKQPWPKAPDRGDLRPIGEDAAQEGDDFRRRARRTPDEDEDDEEDDGEDEEQTEEPFQPAQRRQSTRKGKGKAVVEDDEDEDD